MHFIKYLTTIVLSTFALSGFSQNTEQAGYFFQGENQETIYRLDSLSLRNVDMLSYYYIDSALRRPYNGILTIKQDRKTNPHDSLCIRNGVLNGFHKKYWVVADENSEKTLSSIEFIDPKSGYMLFINDIDVLNNIKRSSSIWYVIFNDEKSNFIRNNDLEVKSFLVYEINYQKKKIDIKRTLTCVETGKKQRQRMKFKSLEELQSYFKSKEYCFYNKCKEMGFFDEELVIPILKGNCNE